MRTRDNGFTALCFAQCAMEHFMRHRICKKHKQIGISDLVFQASLHFRKNLCTALVACAQILIFSYHTFISAYNYHAHILFSPFFRFLFLFLPVWEFIASHRLAHANRWVLCKPFRRTVYIFGGSYKNLIFRKFRENLFSRREIRRQ